MSIDKLGSVEDANLENLLISMADQTEGTIYTDVQPTADTVPLGKKVVYDDGAGTKEIYYKTGKGNLGKIVLA